MWQLENGVWKETGFPFFNFVTTRSSGNMKDPASRERICFSVGADPLKLVLGEQVHGKAVAVVGPEEWGKIIHATDGLITASPGTAVAVFTADCVPIFLGNKEKGVAGVVHAGWKGLYAGIIKEALVLFNEKFGVKPEAVTAAIGPHIQKCCYKTGPDLKEKFGVATSEENLDLSAIAQEQLRSSGVTAVSVNGHCTHCAVYPDKSDVRHERDMFFSFRREKTDLRLMSLIKI